MQRPFLYLSSAEAQLSLGFGAEAPTERLFFAVMPDPATAQRIAAFAASLVADGVVKGKPLLAERLHVTLHHLGDYAGLPASLVARARNAAARIALAAFEVEFDRVASFGAHRQQPPCVLRGDAGTRGLVHLQRALERALALEGIAGDLRFTPHLTLLYGSGLATQPIAPLRWRAHEFVLIRSHLGQTRYEIEGRWPLG